MPATLAICYIKIAHVIMKGAYLRPAHECIISLAMNIHFHPAYGYESQPAGSALIVWLKVVRNLALLVLVSLLSIYGSARGQNLAAGVAVFVLLMVHVIGVEHSLEEASIIIMTGIIGATVELLHVTTHTIQFLNVTQFIGLLPTWIIVTWFAVGATARQSFSALTGKPVLAALTGVTLGTLIYHTAATMGAIEMKQSSVYFLLLAAAPWAAAFPLTLFVANRFFRGSQTAGKGHTVGASADAAIAPGTRYRLLAGAGLSKQNKGDRERTKQDPHDTPKYRIAIAQHSQMMAKRRTHKNHH